MSEKKEKQTHKDTVDALIGDAEIKEHISMGRWIGGTWRGRFMYGTLHVLLFLEGIVWTLMDMLRTRRMKHTKRMHKYYKQYPSDRV